MAIVHEGLLNASGLRIAIVSSRWNALITSRLEEGALDAIKRTGGADDHVTIVRVPGAFEIPMALNRLCRAKQYDAFVCVGAIIRGATPHFEYIASEVTKGIYQAATVFDVPVGYGILTLDTLEQALERAGAKAGNKGFEAATAAIEMATLYQQIGT